MSSGYDLIFDEHSDYRGPYIEGHFCRVWEGDVGCYGSNPDHGMTFDEAKAEIIAWWQALTEDQFNYGPSDEEGPK